MQNIELNDGKLVTIGSMDDVLNLIAENFSHDLKDYIYEHLWKTCFDYDETVKELETAMDKIEELEDENSSLENENWKQRNEIMDLKHEIERIKESKNENADEYLPFY